MALHLEQTRYGEGLPSMITFRENFCLTLQSMKRTFSRKVVRVDDSVAVSAARNKNQ